MVKSKFRLADAATYRKVKDWFDSGRGVSMWTNKDLSNCSRPEMITPGDAAGAPHWAYVGTPEVLTPEDIEVAVRTKVDLPPEWYPECDMCKGTGHRTVTEIAVIRGTSLEDTKSSLNHVEWLDEERFKCNQCCGTGHVVSPPDFRVKRLPPYKGGGFEVSNAGKMKCDKLAAKLDKYYQFQRASNIGKALPVLWDWEHWDNGMARAYFFTESVKPFTEFTE